jgi:hypothetical protein
MSELKSLCEDCGKWPAAAKAALNFREGTAEAVPSRGTRVITQTLKLRPREREPWEQAKRTALRVGNQSRPERVGCDGAPRVLARSALWSQ